ncbi:MAG: phage holin family protein [Schleiferiaceae bacterium]
MENQTRPRPGIFMSLVVNTLSVLAVAYVLPGVHVASAWDAFWVAIVLAILNSTLKPLLVIVTIPFTILTFGLFLLVINAMIIFFAEGVLDGFTVDGFWWAVLFSFLITALNSFLYNLSGREG